MVAPLIAAQTLSDSGILKPLLIAGVIIIVIIIIVVIIWISSQEQGKSGETTGIVGSIVNPFIDLTEKGVQELEKVIPKSYARGVPSRLPKCPPGYTNTGLTCYRGPHSYGTNPIAAACPSGYTNTGLTCYRGPHSYSKKCTTVFKKHPCKAGYTDMGCHCQRWAKTLSGGTGPMTCSADRTKKGGLCHKKCNAGYSWTGTTCFRPAKTLSGGTNPMKCDDGWEIYGGRCYQKCRAGYRPVGLVCWEKT